MCISMYLLQSLKLLHRKANPWLEGDATFKDFLKIEVRAGLGLCDHEHLPKHVTLPHHFMHCITWIGDYGRQLEAQGKQFRLLLRNYDEFASVFITHGKGDLLSLQLGSNVTGT